MATLSVITDGISRDFEHALDVMQEHGLSHAELQYVWDREVGDLSDAQLGRVSEMLRSRDMKVCCISRHIFGSLAVGESEPGVGAHADQLDALRRCISMARELDCRLVRIMSFRKEMILFGAGGAEQWNVATGAWDKLKRLVAPAVQLAEDEGITLAVETGNNAMITSCRLGARLISELGSKRLRVLWDPGNSLYCAERPVPDGLTAVRDCLAHLHVKDLTVDIPGATVHQVRFGEGQMAPYFQALADGLRGIGYSRCVSLESVYRPAGGTFEDGFRASFQRFKGVFG